MNEWLKRIGESVKTAWGKWSRIQKIIVIAVAVGIVVAIGVMFRISSTPSTVRLFNAPITDANTRTQILTRLDKEGVAADVNAAGYILVPDEATADRMRTILFQENLIPDNFDPFEGVFERGWSTTNADQKEKIKQAMTAKLKQHIESIPDVASAEVILVLPGERLFRETQKPVTASVIITPRTTMNSDLLTNRNRIKGIQQLILRAVEGLEEENCVITDNAGNVLNDFSGMEASDRLGIVEKQENLRKRQEAYYLGKILAALEQSYPRRVSAQVDVSMDFSKETRSTTEYRPITIRPDNPDTPYDDSEIRDTLPISQQTVTREWQGTGFNPEGPAGVEGQNPPVYSDMSNVIGRQTETGVTQNNVVNTDQIQVEKSPGIERVTVGISVDGKWETFLNDNGSEIIVTKKNEAELREEYPEAEHPYLRMRRGSILREFTPVSKEELENIADIVAGAIGYDRTKGYIVNVKGLEFDRADEHRAEDAAVRSRQQRQTVIILALVGLAIILIAFILLRVISREMERRRRLREEELLRKQQAARDQALWEANSEGVEVTMSVEERRRAELQENAIAMAKEHPEDVAMLIRTWLMEE